MRRTSIRAKVTVDTVVTFFVDQGSLRAPLTGRREPEKVQIGRQSKLNGRVRDCELWHNGPRGCQGFLGA